MKNRLVRALQAKIIGFQVASIRLNRLIKKTSGHKRMKLRLRKKELGCSAREHLIAYGILKGKEYAQIEKPSRFNKPSAQHILSILREHDPWERKWQTKDAEKQLECALCTTDMTPLPKKLVEPPVQQPSQALS